MKNLFAIFAIVTALLTGGCSSDPMETFNEAVKHADSKNWVKAAKCAKKTAEANPTTLTESFYALCLIQQAKPREASEILEKLALNNSNDSIIQYLYGKSLFDSGRISDAYLYLSKSHRLDKTNKDCLVLLFQVAVKLNKPETGVYYSRIKKDPKLKENAILMNNYGVWLHQKKSNKDYGYFQVASTREKAPAGTTLNKAVSLDKKKRYEAALKSYRKYLTLSKDSVPDDALDVGSRINKIVEYLNSK